MAYVCSTALAVAPMLSVANRKTVSARKQCTQSMATSTPSLMSRSCSGLRTTSKSARVGPRPGYTIRHRSARARTLQCSAALSALLFDCDGVLVDTEKDGHRVTFNAAFKQKGLTCEWGVEEYGELLKIGGGKERMTKYFSDSPDAEPWASLKTEADQQAYVKELHLMKTALFSDMIKAGLMPLRPGVARLVAEALAAGVPVAVCSTSSQQAVSTIVSVLLGEEVAKVVRVFAGDVVPKKKPAPDIYLLAAQTLGLDPAKTVVVEDSAIGLRAAKSAGMKCIVTKSGYTSEEDFSKADLVFPNLGDGAMQVTLKDLRMLVTEVDSITGSIVS